MQTSQARWSAALAAAACALVGALAGCSHSQEMDFGDRPRQRVWDAMVQASREPRYTNWIVVQNQVHVDQKAERVDVYRDLKRDVVVPGLAPRREEAVWRFAATLLPGEPARVEFSSPDWAVPAHFWEQADHYFAQVRMRLTEMGPVTPPPGDPMAAGARPGSKDPVPPGEAPPPAKPGTLTSP